MLPYPIPMELAGGDGGLLAAGTVDVLPNVAPFPLLVDTATVLTTFDDGSGQTSAHVGSFRMWGLPAGGSPVPRFEIDNVQLFSSPLAPVGVGNMPQRIGGVIGGDNLSRFVVSFDYRGATPSLTMMNALVPCNCELSRQCRPVFNVTLAGGQDTQLQGQTYVQIGNDLYNYPPTRVLVDACLEPFPDPLSSSSVEYQHCALQDVHVCPTPQYLPSGVDMKLVVATGFPGLGLSASAYDRLRGAGAAAQLLAGPTVQIHSGDTADEGPSHSGITAAVTTLGRPQDLPMQLGASAMALVGHESFFGPCAELARSRRIRRYVTAQLKPQKLQEPACLISPGTVCSSDGQPPFSNTAAQYANQCVMSGFGSYCDDSGGQNGTTPAAAVVEITSSLPVYVMPDVTPLLVSLNADVRPAQPSIDGVIGTQVLQRIVSTIDYPGQRLVARCVSQTGCVAYAEVTPTVPGNCDVCLRPFDPAALPLMSQCPAAGAP